MWRDLATWRDVRPTGPETRSPCATLDRRAATVAVAFVLAMRGPVGLACLIVIWSLALTAAAIHVTRMTGPERLVGAMFLGLGWLGGLALPGVWIHDGIVS
jgi:predicted membrane channel-forming protein YqfA (hemolysin III family)